MPGHRVPAAAIAAAASIAMNAAPAEDARLYLREQTRLARLQSENLIEQNAFELSQLKWRRFNDQMKGALQIMFVLVGALSSSPSARRCGRRRMTTAW